ncbi:hypothetical protein SISNIDRAFT_210758 [Sistotremastrum niveocremeum HHB9708]|uniref:Uncharacterized protein n=1 Tax=Sistotremastrum niveocremeum HHB9708 TaxID=1314777 RepID=A0A164R189_9AGAM|nr:hypothetical protein SISNIDRAFT_210758 [Sistotremastrum niveocremeum HHB9708]
MGVMLLSTFRSLTPISSALLFASRRSSRHELCISTIRLRPLPIQLLPPCSCSYMYIGYTLSEYHLLQMRSPSVLFVPEPQLRIRDFIKSTSFA